MVCTELDAEGCSPCRGCRLFCRSPKRLNKCSLFYILDMVVWMKIEACQLSNIFFLVRISCTCYPDSFSELVHGRTVKHHCKKIWKSNERCYAEGGYAQAGEHMPLIWSTELDLQLIGMSCDELVTNMRYDAICYCMLLCHVFKLNYVVCHKSQKSPIPFKESRLDSIHVFKNAGHPLASIGALMQFA